MRLTSTSGRVTLETSATSFDCFVGPAPRSKTLLVAIHLFLACWLGLFIWGFGAHWREGRGAKFALLGSIAMVLAMGVMLTAGWVNRVHLNLGTTGGYFARRPFGFTCSIKVRTFKAQIEENWNDGPAGFVLTLRDGWKRCVLVSAETPLAEQEWVLAQLVAWQADVVKAESR